jgi:hypothetical protein
VSGRRLVLFRLLGLFAALLGGGQGAAAPGLTVGVATHFDQGWSLSLIDKVGAAVGLGAIRDDLSWGKIESVRGRYDYSGPSAAYVAKACARGLRLLLMIDPRNRLYDGNATVHSPEGLAAYAAFLNRTLDRFGTRCIQAIEIGNEINGGDKGLPAALPMEAAHAALLKIVADRVKPRHPGVRILGGSSLSVATGFLEQLFRQGALANLDGVVVHPYRDDPEGVDVELRRLGATMRRHGPAKPIWVTETGDEVDDPVTAASLLLRMMCLIGGEPGVEAIYWYALIDEPYYRNTGLLQPDARPKPAGEAMRAMARMLLAKGRPVRIDGGDRLSYVYRFGADSYVLWGVPRAVRIAGPARIFDARGRPLARLDRITAEPVIVVGATRVSLGPTTVVADSLYQTGAAPWAYLARRASGAMVPLRPIDWTWTSYWGDPGLRPLEIGSSTAISAGDGGNPLAPTVRYNAPAAGAFAISACFNKAVRGDGMTVDVRHNGRPISSAILTRQLVLRSIPVRLAAGDRLDFAFGPNQTSEGDGLKYRIRILAAGAGAGEAAPCT